MKGLAHKLATLQRLTNRLYRRLEKQIGIVNKLLTADNIDLVNSETTHLDRIYTELSNAYARAGVAVADDELGENSEEYLALIIRINEADIKYFAAKEQICAWLLQQEQKIATSRLTRNSFQSPAPSVRSHASNSLSEHSEISRQSRKSSRRSSVLSKISNISVMQRAKVEGLRAEAEAIKLTSEAELKAKLLRVQQKIQKAEAIEKVYTQSAGIGNGKCMLNPTGDQVHTKCTGVRNE